MLWSFVPAKIAHDMAPYALKAYTALRPGAPLKWKSLEWRGLEFPNPLGIAGGIDKTASSIEPWWKLGAGFVEIGTVTPEPQSPNPGCILKRDINNQTLWNKMGFPSPGSKLVLKNLEKLPSQRPSPVFINIGKNRTSQDPHRDYSYLIDFFQDHADVFVINISSPNTKGLRSLQDPETISQLLSKCQKKNKNKTPILIKFSPDLDKERLKDNLQASLDAGVDGWILTNTTTQRNLCPHLPQDGGASGAPLTELSRQKLIETVDYLGSQKEGKLLISTGGILDAEEAQRRLDIGADLLQVYSALVLKGPQFLKKTAQHF